jgi:hypothetical protein
MATIAGALNAAVRHHRAGQLAQAEQLYRQVLAVDPRQFDDSDIMPHPTCFCWTRMRNQLTNELKCPPDWRFTNAQAWVLSEDG